MPTLEQIQTKMKKLQAQAESLIAKRAQSVLNDIRKLMEEHGLTTSDIDAHSSAKRKPGRRAGAVSGSATMRKKVSKSGKSATKGKLPPKYLNSKTGQTWSGHARPPQWIKVAKDRSVFLIDGAGTVERSASKPAGKRAVTRKTAARKIAGKKTAAKSRTVKTVGATASKAPTKKAAAKKALAAVKTMTTA
jgi:DNA-binding protein H-NS